jgi:aminopeptidase N
MLCVGLLSSASAVVMAAERFDFDRAGGRLPKDVTPILARIALDLDPARDSFSGSVQIELEVRRAVDAIVLNAHQLGATGARLTDATGRARVLVVTADKDRQQWRLTTEPATPIAAGRYTVAIDYGGRVESAGQGLYSVSYRLDGVAEPQKMLATQLEPAFARRVFPGFDEPAFRTRFELTATVPERWQVVSNMPPVQDRVDAGKRQVRFAATPAMPSYLFSVAVGEFDALEDEQDGVKLRILTAKGKRTQGAYAMQATKQLLRYYADYFGVPYMLPKLDQLAVPGTRNGAMEDWGLISYNEGALLFDPARSPPAAQRWIFSIVAHEISHQWFGNLVTAGWWDDIWLNEAFADWMADKASEHFNPQWNLKLRARESKEYAMRRDAGTATRPITMPITSEDQFFGVFDEITYQKGGAVLTMFEAALGAESFRDGLRRYMRAHAYSNATAGDLWFHLSQAANRDVSGQIAAWIAQPGFPVLDVATRCVNGRIVVTLAQQRYSGDPARQASGSWQVPVVLAAGRARRSLVLTGEPATLALAGCAAPVLANAGDAGYYRVRYSAADFARLRAAFSKLPATERIGLLADTFALTESGRIPVADYLSLVASGSAGRGASEWRAIVERLERLDHALRGTPAQAALRAWSRGMLAPELARLSWLAGAGDDSQTLSLRADLIDALGQFEDAQTIAHARALDAKGSDGAAVPVSLRTAVTNTLARYADEAGFERLRAACKAATREEDASMLRKAMTMVRDPKLVARVQALALTDEWEPSRAAWIASNVGPNSGVAEPAYRFVEVEFGALAAKASDWGRPWLLPDAAGAFNEAARADELLAIQKRLLGEPGQDAAQQAAAGIRRRAGLREREGSRLGAQLKTLSVASSR